MVERVRLKGPKIDRSDDVGYRKPPRQTQFKPGKSGNPKGRPKGVANFSTDLQKTLSTSVKVKRNGRDTSVSTQRATLMVLREKALTGDARALDHFIELAARLEARRHAVPARELNADDQAILTAYVKEALHHYQGQERPGLEMSQPKMKDTAT
jgi:hypothetical protein